MQNDSTLSALNVDTLSMSDAVALWRAGNNAGMGQEAPGGETDVDAAVESLRADGYGLDFRAQRDGEVSVLSNGDEVVAVGNCNGAWMVTISNEAVRRAAAKTDKA